MSDLKARIGPKVAPGQFPNKTWLRPGYEAKPSPKRVASSSWQEERHGTGFDDLSTDGFDSSPIQSISSGTNSRPKPSLFARMGIVEDALESVETDSDNVAKSLIDRIEATEDSSGKYQDELSFRNATLGSRWQPIDVDALDEDYDIGRPLVNNSQPKVVVKSEPIEVDLDFDNARAISAPNSEAVIDELSKQQSSEDRGVSFKNKITRKTQETEEVQQHNSLTTSASNIQNGSMHLTENGVDSPPLPRFQNQSNNGVIAHLKSTELPHENSQHKKMTRSSDPEEGELPEPSADQVRVTFLPLMMRIAEQRQKEFKETESEPSSHPTLLSPHVVTDEACSSFVRRADHIRQEIDSHSATSFQERSNTNLHYSPAPAPTTSSSIVSVGQKGVSRSLTDANHGISSGKSNRPSISRNDALSTPSFIPSAKEISSGSSQQPSSTSSHQRNATLRYTPSPLREQSRGHLVSTQTSPSISEHNYKRRRSPSPRYRTRRGSLSRGRPYSKRSSYRREARSPGPDHRRRPLKGHEVHSPERSPMRSRAHEVHSPERGQSRRDGHEAQSPEPHHERYPTRSGQARSAERYRVQPRQSTRYRTHSPPSTMKPFFHDRDMQYSPEPVSPSGPRPNHSHRTSRHHHESHPHWKNEYSGDQWSTSPHQSQRQRSYTPQGYSSSLAQKPGLHRLPSRNSYSPDKQRQNRTKESASHQMSTSPFSGSIRSYYSKEDNSQEKKYVSYDRHHTGVQDHQTSPLLSRGKEYSSIQSYLPCHNVPGLWFVHLALNELGTLDCKFEIDYKTARRWNLSSSNYGAEPHSTENLPLKIPQNHLSLQICSFSKQLVEEVIRTHGPDATPEDIAKAIFALPQSWPAAGHLIVSVNPETEKTRTWLPYEFGPNHPTIQIEDYVFEGYNVVQFIQLSGIPESIFALFAAEKMVDTDTTMGATPFLPGPLGVETTMNSISVEVGAVTVSPLNSQC